MLVMCELSSIFCCRILFPPVNGNPNAPHDFHVPLGLAQNQPHASQFSAIRQVFVITAFSCELNLLCRLSQVLFFCGVQFLNLLFGEHTTFSRLFLHNYHLEHERRILPVINKPYAVRTFNEIDLVHKYPFGNLVDVEP